MKLLEGNLGRMNPDAPIEDQLDLLPYDPKYEFPVNHLVLGENIKVYLNILSNILWNLAFYNF